MKPNDDIHEIVYNIEGEKFQITYHRESSKIAPSTREFLKPANWNDKGNTWSWSSDLHSTYQVYLIKHSKYNQSNFIDSLFKRPAMNLNPKRMLIYSCN